MYLLERETYLQGRQALALQAVLRQQGDLQGPAGLLQPGQLSLRVQDHRREEQCPQDPGAERLRLRPGGGHSRVRG